MKLIFSAKDRIDDLNDLSFCEKFKISLNRARLNGRKGITQSQFAQKVGLSESSISKAQHSVHKDSDNHNSRARREIQKLIDRVFS